MCRILKPIFSFQIYHYVLELLGNKRPKLFNETIIARVLNWSKVIFSSCFKCNFFFYRREKVGTIPEHNVRLPFGHLKDRWQ